MDHTIKERIRIGCLLMLLAALLAHHIFSKKRRCQLLNLLVCEECQLLNLLVCDFIPPRFHTSSPTSLRLKPMGRISRPTPARFIQKLTPMGRISRPTPARFIQKQVSCSLIEQEQQKESAASSKFNPQENALIDALIGIQGRGRVASRQRIRVVEQAVQVLEGLPGVLDPTSSSLIEGPWQLMFTTRPDTASPIQRSFVGVDSFTVIQEVYLRTNDPRVSNIVKISDGVGELKVEALATIEDGKRILFQFDRAAFSFKFLPFKVPYPVPFRLLGDEAKGWLDTTYLSPSGSIRISRGNKGTIFVLQKETDSRQKLLSAISGGRGTDVRKAIDNFIDLNQNVNKSELEFLEGKWQMVWSSQVETDSWIENAANGLMGMQIVKADGSMEFLVDILFGFKFSMTGRYLKLCDKTYEVTMDDAAIIIGPYGLPVEIQTKLLMEIWYSDENMRISSGYNRILFVHVRVEDS